MARKPGWTYIYSYELQQEIAYHNATGWVYCKDGTKYSPQEVETLRKTGGIILATHLLKAHFEGEVIDRPGTKTPTTRPATSRNNPQNQCQTIQEDNPTLQTAEPIQLEIF